MEKSHTTIENHYGRQYQSTEGFISNKAIVIEVATKDSIIIFISISWSGISKLKYFESFKDAENFFAGYPKIQTAIKYVGLITLGPYNLN